MTEDKLRSSGGCFKPFLAISCISVPINFIGGAMFGQSAGMLPQLLDPNSLVHITSEEATWIGEPPHYSQWTFWATSLCSVHFCPCSNFDMCCVKCFTLNHLLRTGKEEGLLDRASISVIGTLISSSIGGTFSDIFGRVRACQIGYLCLAIGYGVIAGADRFIMLFLGRFLLGLGFGIYFPALVYVSELAPPAYRSLFLSLTPLVASAGLVYIYIVGGYLPWHHASALTCLFSIIGLCLTFLCYDSPPWLVRKNKIEEARKSLNRIEHSANVDAKLKELQDIASSQDEAKSVNIRVFMEPTVWKPFLMIFVISIIQSACGFYIIIHYTVVFMREFNSTYDPLQVTIMIGMVRLVSTMIGSFLMSRMYRRTLGAVSGFGSAASLSLIFAYLSFAETNAFLSKNSWIPICLLLAYVVTTTLGIYPLPWALPHEVFPNKVRGAMCGASFAAMSATMFASVKLYYVFIEHLGLKGLIFMFAVASMLFGIFSLTLLVETHGRTLDEIEEEFSGTKKGTKESKHLESKF